MPVTLCARSMISFVHLTYVSIHSDKILPPRPLLFIGDPYLLLLCYMRLLGLR
jgi:hypothetical protein